MIRYIYESVIIGATVFFFFMLLWAALGNVQIWCDKDLIKKEDRCYLKWVQQ